VDRRLYETGHATSTGAKQSPTPTKTEEDHN
jgi:hypothetical protein